MIDLNNIRFNPIDGLIPACVQDHQSMQVLMIGYMNQEAIEKTLASGYVTFYSRSKQRLWTKGESSGHTLKLIGLALDCDEDALLVYAEPAGPTCHMGTRSCFKIDAPSPVYRLWQLHEVIAKRAQEASDDSYTHQLLTGGMPRIAQKVGEEGVEVALAAVCGSDEELVGEVVDLLYHVWVLLYARTIPLQRLADLMHERGVDE